MEQNTAVVDETRLNMEEEPMNKKSANKSHMEKKRRERINRSLVELKALVLGSIKKDASYYSKLEKADILEMTVEHVRFLQTQINSAQSCDNLPLARYRAGFATCATEMTRLLTGLPGLEESVKFNLLKRLAEGCVSPTTDEGAIELQQPMYTTTEDAREGDWEAPDSYHVGTAQKENAREVYGQDVHRRVKKDKLKGIRSRNKVALETDGQCSIDQSPRNTAWKAPHAAKTHGSSKHITSSLATRNSTVLPTTILLPVRLPQSQDVIQSHSSSNVWRPW